MAEPEDGLDLIRKRMERASRRPPPPRRPRADAAPTEASSSGEGRGATVAFGSAAPAAPVAVPAAVSGSPVPDAPAPPAGRARRAPGRAVARPAPDAPLRLAADLPSVNLAIRVRRPLDDRLADLIHRLRQDGVRTSKVELIEMLLWELGPRPEDAVSRLARFREWAPRGAGAPLGGDVAP